MPIGSHWCSPRDYYPLLVITVSVSLRPLTSYFMVRHRIIIARIASYWFALSSYWFAIIIVPHRVHAVGRPNQCGPRIFDKKNRHHSQAMSVYRNRINSQPKITTMGLGCKISRHTTWLDRLLIIFDPQNHESIYIFGRKVRFSSSADIPCYMRPYCLVWSHQTVLVKQVVIIPGVWITKKCPCLSWC